MNPLVFRCATGNDSEAIAALHTDSWRDAYRGILPDLYFDTQIFYERANLWRSRFSSLSSDRFLVVLAEGSGETVGFACVLLDENLNGDLASTTVTSCPDIEAAVWGGSYWVEQRNG